MEALAARAPVVVTIDDLHWADPTSVDLVQSLLPMTARLPLLVLLRFRPEDTAAGWAVHEAAGRDLGDRYTVIELGPLPEAAARDLVANLLRIEGLTREVRDLILRKAEGNPFFVEEVIRSLLDAGIVVPEGARFVVVGDAADFQVPDTLIGVLSARVDALEPATRRVLQAAAVVGREFSHEMLRELVDRSRAVGRRAGGTGAAGDGAAGRAAPSARTRSSTRSPGTPPTTRCCSACAATCTGWSAS